jgi:hypothetical protein
MQWSLVLLFVAAASLIWLENRDKTNVNKIKVKAAASSYTKQDLIKKIDEIPSWVSKKKLPQMSTPCTTSFR